VGPRTGLDDVERRKILLLWDSNYDSLIIQPVASRYTDGAIQAPRRNWYIIEIPNYIVTDLINALPGNSSVNMVQYATTEEAVFSVSAVTSHNSR
jgi:hypothetical protein